jgi:hypothetical protein
MNRFLAFSVVSFLACLSISYVLKAEAAAYASEASRPSQLDDCAPSTYWAAVTAAAIVAE